jgi:hypothetical protein
VLGTGFILCKIWLYNMFDIAEIMDNVFLQSGFEEPVIYTPSGSSPITINAIVFRAAERTIDLKAKAGIAAAREYKIEIYISATDIPIVKVSTDSVRFKRFVNDIAETTFRVAGIIYADAGSFRLGLL